MTDPINLTQLRASVHDRGLPAMPYIVEPDVLLALIDAAEAARELLRIHGGPQSPGSIAGNLRESLARFTQD